MDRLEALVSANLKSDFSPAELARVG